MNNTVAITRILDDDVEQAVFKALDHLEASKLMKDGMFVLLKPNMLSAKPPERAVTTHPKVLEAVIHWVKKFNPKRIVVADSSAGISRGTTEKVFKESGLQAACESENVECTPFESTSRELYHVENPLALEEFPASSLLKEADLIINLPKIKTHGLTKLTCSIKNMFGTLLLGQKPKTHAAYPGIRQFSDALADVYSVFQPALTIVDGYLCQEGRGPAAGDVVKLDVIVSGFNGLLVDQVICNIIGLDPSKVHHLSSCIEKGLGPANLDGLELLGEPIESVKRDFKIPRGSPLAGAPMPRFIANFVANKLFKAKIKFDDEACKLCGTCWKNCPVEAISPPDEMMKGNIPRWDSKKCIACYCCAETCPYEAIEFAMHPIRNAATTWEFYLILAAGIVILVLLIKLIRFIT